MQKVLLCGLLLAVMLVGCETSPQSDIGLGGRILLWHAWNEKEAVILDQVLADFNELNPQAKVISISVAPDQLLQQYETNAAQGLGPDLLIGSSEWIRRLVEAGLIDEVDLNQVVTSDFLSYSLAPLRYQESLYGLPLALYPVALYYNKNLVREPPATLEELIEDSSREQAFAMVSRFQPAYWGIRAFGGGLFDEEGSFVLAQSGFTDWLTWLSNAQRESGILLERDDDALRELFIEESIAYYVASPEELSTLQEALGDSLAVTPLPSGPNGFSRPLLPVEAVMLGSSSSASQREIALRAAQFLTNTQQSRTYFRTLNRVPANRRVIIDPRVHPRIASFVEQSRTAVSLPNVLFRDTLYELGDRAYANVLSGILTPSEAVCEFGQAVVELQGYQEDQADLPESCNIRNIEE